MLNCIVFLGDVRTRCAWDDTLIDALCEPAETFTFGGVFAHIVTFNAHRRLMALDAIRQLGVPTEGFGDPMEWQPGESNMSITADTVREMFKGLESGDGAAFFKHVAEDVDWTVMGTHPLAGRYLSKRAFIEGTFAKLGQVLPCGAQLRTENVIVQESQAAVELRSLAVAKNGMRFDNRYCWIIYFRGDLIARVRAYLDSAMVSRLFEENPIA